MRRHFLPQKSQSEQHPVLRFRSRNKSTLIGDAKCRQTEACGGDTGYYGVVVRLHITSIPYQPGLGASLFPKKLEISLFKFIQKLLIIRRKNGRVRRRLRATLFFLGRSKEREYLWP